MDILKATICASALIFAAPAMALPAGFTTGPVFDNFGPTAPVSADTPIPENAQFKVAFDVSNVSDSGTLNRSFESAARFINMHVKAGVPIENISLAIVVHGGASVDLTNRKFYAAKKEGKQNGNIAAIAELQKKGVTFHLCGQSAAAYNISNADLLPGVKMDLSAMTAHALLQQEGYTLNPF